MSTILKPGVSPKDNSQGNPEAVLTLVEYGDYQCLRCGQAYPVVKKIQQVFRGQLRFIFRHFPLQNLHPLALPAALATEAAARQNRFWEMHDLIFENQDQLHANSFRDFTKKLNIDVPKFENDCNDPSILRKVEDDFDSGIVSGVNDTPTFFINGSRYDGSWEEAELETRLRHFLNN